MIGRRRSLSAQVSPLVFAFGLALPLVALTGRLAPLGGVSGVEIGNDFVAFVGLGFSAIQIVANWRSPASRAAWGWAAIGTMAIAAEDHLAPQFVSLAPNVSAALASAVLWICAASMIAFCGRRYAMRRGVSAAMSTGLALAVSAVAFNLTLYASGAATAHPGWSQLQDFLELAVTVTLVAGLLLTRLSPPKSYRFAPEHTGLRARRLFYDFGLETRRRYPVSHPILALPVFRHVVLLAVIARFWLVAAGAVSRDCGRGVLRQLLDLWRLAFVHGVDAKSYYVHELYRPEPGLFDATMTRVETKNGLNRRLQLLRADRPGPSDLNDKLAFFRACEAHGVASAPIMATVEGGALTWMSPRAAFDRDLFVKDRQGRGGCFTLNFERIGPFLYRADDGALVNLEELVHALRTASASRRLIVQPKLRNHAAIRPLADKALVVFRVMTCMDQSGDPQVTHGVLRLLRRFEPNWPKTPDADWGCAIDVDTGEFGPMTGDAPETCTRWFVDHPVTGERVTGRRLEGWGEIADLAVSAHRAFSARVLVGWDIGWTPEGPVILEGNSNPDFSYFQRVSRTPVGRSPLGPLLNAHLAELTRRLLAADADGRPL